MVWKRCSFFLLWLCAREKSWGDRRVIACRMSCAGGGQVAAAAARGGWGQASVFYSHTKNDTAFCVCAFTCSLPIVIAYIFLAYCAYIFLAYCYYFYPHHHYYYMFSIVIVVIIILTPPNHHH